VLAQRVDVVLVDRRSEVRELRGELAERALARGQVGLAPVVGDVCCELCCGALGTEVVGVRPRSVVTFLLG
jgi:hypothetical protein